MKTYKTLFNFESFFAFNPFDFDADANKKRK